MPQPVIIGAFPAFVSETTEQTNDGLFQLTEVRVFNRTNVTTPVIGSTISRAGKTLCLTNFTISVKDSLATVTSIYSAPDPTTPPVYEVVSTVVEEPIASHPAFTAPVTQGGFSFPLSIVSAAGASMTQGGQYTGGVVFNSDGAFVEFNKDSANNFFGVQSYLSPRTTYKVTYSSGTAPTSADTVSYIYSSPTGSPPSLPSGRNWILTGVSWENNGKVDNGQYKITEEYLASGFLPWNNVIYYTEN